jgi:hypothetical protein
MSVMGNRRGRRGILNTIVSSLPNDKAKRRAGNMPAKKDDADRRVRLSAMFGGCSQRTTASLPTVVGVA